MMKGRRRWAMGWSTRREEGAGVEEVVVGDVVAMVAIWGFDS